MSTISITDRKELTLDNLREFVNATSGLSGDIPIIIIVSNCSDSFAKLIQVDKENNEVIISNS